MKARIDYDIDGQVVERLPVAVKPALPVPATPLQPDSWIRRHAHEAFLTAVVAAPVVLGTVSWAVSR